MINIASIIPAIFFIVVLISIVTSIKNNKIQRIKIEQIKDGLEPRTIINQELLLKGKNSGIVFYIVFLIVSAFIFGGMFTMQSSSNIVMFIPIGIFALMFFIVPILGISNSVKYNNAIKNDNYYVEEDILVNKYTRRSDKSTHYYFEFQGQDKRIKTTSSEFYKAEIGEKFYIIFAGNSRSAYNATLYQLEDESKITRRIS